MNHGRPYTAAALVGARRFLICVTVLAASLIYAGCERAGTPATNQNAPAANQNAPANQSTAPSPAGREGVGEMTEQTFATADEVRKFIQEFKDKLAPADKPIIISGGSLKVESEVNFKDYTATENYHVLTHPSRGFARAVIITRNLNETTQAVTTYTLPPGARTNIDAEFAGNSTFVQLDPAAGTVVLKCLQYSFKDDFKPKGTMDTKVKTFESNQHKNMKNVVLYTDVPVNTPGGQKPPGHKFPHPDPTEKGNEVMYIYRVP